MPPGETMFSHRGIIWTNMVDVYLVMLPTKYLGFIPCRFFTVYLFAYIKISAIGQTEIW